MKGWRRGVSLRDVPALAWRLQQEAERVTGIAKATFYDEIGTLYHHFGQPEAEEWFRKAITGYRAMPPEQGVGIRPSIKAALLFWKTGDRDECHAECRRLLERYRTTADTATSPEGEQKLSIALNQVLMASFLLGRYTEAIAAADRGVALSERLAVRQGHKASYPMAMAIREMSIGVVEGDGAGFERGLDRLTARIDRWPTSASGRRRLSPAVQSLAPGQYREPAWHPAHRMPMS